MSEKDAEIIAALDSLQDAVLESKGTAADSRRRSALQAVQRLVDPRRRDLDKLRAQREIQMQALLNHHEKRMHQTHELNTQVQKHD